MNHDRTIVDLLEASWARYRDFPAFTCLGRTLTYGDVDRLSRNFAAYLQHRTGLQPGDRIAIQLPNLLQYPVVAYGALRAGLVLVNTNPLYTATEVERQLADSGAKALVVMSAQAGMAIELSRRTSLEAIFVTHPLDLHAVLPEASPREPDVSDVVTPLAEALHAGAALAMLPVDIEPETLALLQYTGGTTGVAKGAMLSHRNLVANTTQLAVHSSEFFREGAECYVAPLPVYHIYAFTIHCVALPHRGGHSLLIPNPRDIPALIAAIRNHRFTGFPGINTLFASLCANPEFRQLDFSSLRSTSAGGMALTAEVASQWRELTGIAIAEGYGMSETSPVITANPPGRIQAGTVGMPIPGTEVRVIDGDGNTLPAGERGELCVRGPQVMQGYWQRPDETALVLSPDGWLRTGDVALVQADGYIRIVDRIKDMIVVSGFNVYPNEVENVARMHPSVKECAAIGVPDKHAGEAVKLFVVPTSDAFSGEVLRHFMRSQLTPYKLPTQFEVVDDLPKSNVGKILRKELRKTVPL